MRKTSTSKWLKVGLFAAALGGVLPAAAEPLTVVELFTSQGCSSCPPANANLAKLAATPGVLALSYGVTYWDRLGWKDTFASPKYTQRQYDYVKPLGNSSPFTPQIVVNGKADVVGNRIGELTSLIGSSGLADSPAVSLAGGKVTIGTGKTVGGGADVWLVRYDPRLVQVPVGRGENSGRTLGHKNVVHELRRLGSWSGKATSLALPAAKKGLRSAVLVQAPNGGAILAAAQ